MSFEMKISIFIIAMVGLCSAIHIRDGLNTLIPDNDVNRHAKLKEILSEDDVDPSELETTDYVNISSPLVEKLIERNNVPLVKTNFSDIMNVYGRPIDNAYNRIDEKTNEEPTIKNIPLNPPKGRTCLLGDSSDTLKWVDENGRLRLEYIENDKELEELEVLDLNMRFTRTMQIVNISILSLAVNSLDGIPVIELEKSQQSLKYLSFFGNALGLFNNPINFPNLEALDLRYNQFKTIEKHTLEKLIKLKFLYLSNNEITSLSDDSFHLPSLIHLDLSYNNNNKYDEKFLLPKFLKMSPNVFERLKSLQILDFSHTNIEVNAFLSLQKLSNTVMGLSICYTELISCGDNFLSNLSKIKLLDVSGNTQLNFTKRTFSAISSTLETLHAQNANIDEISWTKPLINLRELHLKDNKIRNLDNNSFSHMLYLKDLNLEKNSLGNWYTRLFSQNQELETLNLRENILTMFTDDMMKDILSVKSLAIGKNQFECNCNYDSFLQLLFQATKEANLPQLQQTVSSEGVSFLPLMNSIISRTNERYYDQLAQSIEALKKNTRSRPKKLLSLSEAEFIRQLSFRTVLLDFDVENEYYMCWNVTKKERQSMLDLIDQCEEMKLETSESNRSMDQIIMIALSTSIPAMIIFFLLLTLIYWKWWHIRSFYVLCKNSAILTYMDDNDDGKEAIVKRESATSLDLTLYDVFVSYSDYNRSWVLDEFIPNIEKRESINVCLHERDFTVGYGILDNIVSCMDRSRCLLLLISHKFLESQWCQFEMNLAQHRLLETRKEKLIVVLLEDVPTKMQPKTLRYLMKTKTYIKWPENGSNDEKQLFWKRLKKSIISSRWENENESSKA